MRTSRLMWILTGGIMLVGAGAAGAQEWPQWRGANRDARASGFTAPRTWPKELTPKWKESVGTGDATPALVGDKLYVFTRQGTDEVTTCLEADSGKTVWQKKYAANVAVSGPAGSHPGPRSSPAVAEGKIVTFGVGGILSCLNAADGELVWRKEFSKQFPRNWPVFYTSMSPVIVDGTCVAHLGGQGKGALMAFDLKTGDQKWAWEGDAPAYASPVVMTVDGVKQVVEEGERFVVGVGADDGKLLWQISFAPSGRMSYNAATPIVDGPTLIFTAGGRGTRAVTLGKQGNTFTPRDLWNNPDTAAQFNTPVLKDQRLYGISDRGNLFCIDASNGKTLWTDSTRHQRGFGSIIDAGPVLLALTPQSQLIVFKPSDSQFEQVAQIKVADTPTYAYPVVSGNRLFIKDQDSVAMFVIQ